MARIIKDPMREAEIVNLLDLVTRLLLSDDVCEIEPTTKKPRSRKKVLPNWKAMGVKRNDPFKESLRNLVRAKWQLESQRTVS